MNIKTHTGLVGFLLALSALNISSAQAAERPDPSIEGRLNRITNVIRERELQLQGSSGSAMEQLVASGWADGHNGDWGNVHGRGWADGKDNRGWVNTHRSNWGNGSNGHGFANTHPWRNGFYNHY